MTEIVVALRAPIKPLAKIDAAVTVFHDDKPAEKLSAAERLLAGYAVANHAAISLAERGDITSGHRAAMHAHLVSILQREGERETRQFLRLLAAQVGLDCHDNGSETEDEPLDLTD